MLEFIYKKLEINKKKIENIKDGYENIRSFKSYDEYLDSKTINNDLEHLRSLSKELFELGVEISLIEEMIEVVIKNENLRY